MATSHKAGEVYIMPETGPERTYHYVGAEARIHSGCESFEDIGWMHEDDYFLGLGRY